MRIIYIITFPPKYEYLSGPEPDFVFRNCKDETIGVWRIDWGHVIAKNVKKFFPEVQYEVWRLDYRAEKEYVHVFDDGVIHRSFPAQSVNFLAGLKRSKFWFSKELLEKIKYYIKYRNSEKDIIFHVPLDFNFFGHIIIKKVRKVIPLIHTSNLSQHIFEPKVFSLNPFKVLHRLRRKQILKKHLGLLTEIAVTPDKTDFFKKHTSANVYTLDTLNFDFEWSEKGLSKKAAREKLNIEQDDFILFSSSRLVPEKQLDKLLLELAKIKKSNFKYIISGAGSKEYQNYLMNLAKKLGLNSRVRFVGFLTDRLKEFYCASDVFITVSSSESGPVSALKAMALGVPVITTDTGIAAYLLKQHDSGIILNNEHRGRWSEQIDEVINGKKIKVIDPAMLSKKFALSNWTRQLFNYYQQSINNFWRNN